PSMATPTMPSGKPRSCCGKLGGVSLASGVSLRAPTSSLSPASDPHHGAALVSKHKGNRMTAAELKVARESLGLSGDWLATYLGVNSRTVREWEQGRRPVPDWVRLEIESLE